MAKNKPKATLYEVIAPDDSIFLKRTGKYLKRGEQVELTPEEVETLLGAELISEVENTHQQPIEEEQQEN